MKVPRVTNRISPEIKKQILEYSFGDRLKRLEKYSAEIGKVLTESRVAALEGAKVAKQVHGEIETFHPGFLFGQDIYRRLDQRLWKNYQQTGIDKFSNIGFAKLYLDKTAIAIGPCFNRPWNRLLRKN